MMLCIRGGDRSAVAAFGAIFFSALVNSGCGETIPEPPQVAEVRGSVTYNGAPLGGAGVVFIPEIRGTRGAMGMTDQNGEITLSTYFPNDGAPVGWCKVGISRRAPSPPRPPGMEDLPPEIQVTGKALIPEKYMSTETSGLRVEIVAGTVNEFTFKLEGDVRP